jgi:glutaredoxin
MADKKITVYALSTCPWCRKAKQFFKDHNIVVEEIDFDLCDPKRQEEALAQMKRFGAGDSFPFVLIGNDPIEGFDPDRYCELLGIQQ